VLYVRQPGCFTFLFWFSIVPNITHLDIKVDFFMSCCFLHTVVYEKNLYSLELNDSCWDGFVFLSSVIPPREIIYWIFKWDFTNSFVTTVFGDIFYLCFVGCFFWVLIWLFLFFWDFQDVLCTLTTFWTRGAKFI
jgi:hypothetical protein